MTESLAVWLERLERRTPESNIRLGLDRVRDVLNRLPGILPEVPVITVGGTNGKGSVVAMLEEIYTAGGYRALAYTSPHLLRFAERIRVDQTPVDDASLARALATVEACRGTVKLTYFEHVTLAALCVAAMKKPDVLLLEVGLGGRLDAVNAVDPDVAIITMIGLDHVDWLGGTRRSIAKEKGGIARPGKPLIVGERRPPAGWITELEAGNAEVVLAGRDFRWQRAGRVMRLFTGDTAIDLPPPGLPGRHQWANAACAAMAVLAMQRRLPISSEVLATGLREAKVPGRMQKLCEHPAVWVDVAHNLQSAQALAAMLKADRMPTTAIFSALAGKDIAAIATALGPYIDYWIVLPLDSDRALSTGEIVRSLEQGAVSAAVETVESTTQAVQRAFVVTPPEGRIVAFGSFRTVAEVWPIIQQREY